MTWTCRLVKPILDKSGCLDLEKMEIGDMWFVEPTPACPLDAMHLSGFYFAQNAERLPLAVALPCKGHPERRGYFLIDGKCYSAGQGYYGGWTVIGEPPAITVAPSINLAGTYHGYLQNGVIGDPL